MAGSAPANPKVQFLTSVGVPLVNGTVTVYLAGTTTQTDTWQDSALSTLNTNPITLDARGEATVWLDSTKTYKFVLKDALGVPQWTVDNVQGAVGQSALNSLSDDITAVSTNLAASGGAALVGFIQAGTGAVARTLQDKGRDVVTDADFNTTGDGTADDTTPLTNAIACAIARGVPLVLDGTKTYGVTALTLTTNLRLKTNGATIKDLAGSAGNTPLITVNAGCDVDFLNVSIPAGITRDRVAVLTGASPKVDHIKVSATSQQANTSDNDDAAVRVSSATNPIVGFIEVTNYDRAVQFLSCTGGYLGPVHATSYVRGLLLEDCADIIVNRPRCVTASANASYTVGHVGILISGSSTDSSRNITVLDPIVEDSGEHGIRVGGPEQQSNIAIVRPRIKNVGGSGIKILGTDSGTPTARNKRIQIIDPIIEDCGSGTLTSNMCGIVVMYADNVRITNPVIRKESKLQCGYAGIRVVAASDVHIVQPDIDTATWDAIWGDGSLGDIDRLHITGGIGRNCGRDGLRGTTGVSTTTFRRWHVNGFEADSNTGLGLNIAIGGGTMVDSLFRMKVYNNTAGAAACDSTAAALDVFGSVGSTPLSGISATPGSRWSNGVNLYSLVSTTWTATA